MGSVLSFMTMWGADMHVKRMSALFEVDDWWLMWHTWIAAIHSRVTILLPSCTVRHVKMRGIARWEIMPQKWFLIDYDIYILSLCCSSWHQPLYHPYHQKEDVHTTSWLVIQRSLWYTIWYKPTSNKAIISLVVLYTKPTMIVSLSDWILLSNGLHSWWKRC